MADNPIVKTGDSVSWNFPKGKEGVKFVAQLSENMRPEVQQKYITLGAVCSAFSGVPTEEIISILKELGYWED
tara:strand:+ start:549 stop:767 length:219 start_codon:yes stop_codon:yes gene_type:complete